MTAIAAPPSPPASSTAHLSRQRSDWVPPPVDWMGVWGGGNRDLLPYGLLSPIPDFLWRWMYCHPTRHCDTGEMEQIRAGLTYAHIRSALRKLLFYQCAQRDTITAIKAQVVFGSRGSGHNRMERMPDWSLGRNPKRKIWLPIVPQTPTARHLRELHNLPTPDPPIGLSRQRQRVWDVLAEHAIGAAAHVSAVEIGRRIGLSHTGVQSHITDLRRAHPGVIRKLPCATSVYRLRSGRGFQEYSRPDNRRHKQLWEE